MGLFCIRFRVGCLGSILLRGWCVNSVGHIRSGVLCGLFSLAVCVCLYNYGWLCWALWMVDSACFVLV